MNKQVRLLQKLARYHALAVNAKTRSMQYPGFETGKKAALRYEHYEWKFSETLEALEQIIK